VGKPGEISAADILAPVMAEMGDVEARLRQEIEIADPSLVDLLKDASLMRGKGLRPGLVLLSARATGTVVADHVTLAAALEMIHNATLIHDDILDDATARRNHMTLNLKHQNETAVLTGDYIFARAFVLASSLSSPSAIAAISRMTSVVCRGEIKQVLRRFDAAMDEDDYLSVITDKTAALYETAAELGARLAGASEGRVRAMAGYGQAIGVAFQIIDDCLDLVGQEEVMGKTLATDLDKGKLTLPIIQFLKQVEPEVRDTVLELIGDEDVTRTEKRERVLGLLRDRGAVEYAYGRASEEIARAKGLLRDLDPSPARESLERLADFVVSRQI